MSYYSKLLFSCIILCFSLVLTVNAQQKKGNMEKELKRFIQHYEAKVVGLSKETSLAYFDATISGKEEDYKKSADLQIKLSKLYCDKKDFAQLKKIKDSNQIKDEILKRELDLLYTAYLSNQGDKKLNEKMINLGSQIEKKFSTYRSELDNKKYTDNEIEEILKTSSDSKQLETAWLASKKIGNVVSGDVIALVKMRNEYARQLGFANFHEMSLQLNEQKPAEIEKLFDELDNLTRATFAKVKGEMDEVLAAKYNVPKDALMPWHYQNRYFQEAPKIYNVDLDKYYKDKDIAELTKNYYKSIGLPIDAMVAKSDLYEKEGKYQHAYCTGIDRVSDVRVVCNIKPNANWMETMLHEFGHANYAGKNIDQSLPWQLKTEAHIFTTEAIAEMFGRFASSPAWLHDNVGISKDEQSKIEEESFKSLRLQQLVFSRWVQVVYRFEKSMYSNPDQDLNKLWWDLAEKYQMIKRPENRNEPDWASKIHIASYPCYYHNYLLGELLASQLLNYINKNVLKNADQKNESFTNKKAVGEYLLKNVFQPGAKYRWDEMIKRATGEELTAKYYSKQFVD